MTPRFDIDAVRHRAGDKVFARGECSCPAFEDFGFCKHMVAVALAANQAGPPEDGGTLERIRAYLLTKDATALTALLLDQAERDEALFRRLEMLAAAASDDDKTVLARLRKAATATTRTGGFVDYREAGDWAAGVEEALDMVAALVPAGRAAIARILADHALARIEAAIDTIDDSDGYCSDLLHQARNIHLAACQAAPPEPVALARDLFAREVEGDWDTFEGAADLYAEVLGETGLTEYRRLATAAWAKIPPLHGGRRARDDVSSERRRLAKILDGFAERDGDVEARIALRAHDLSSPWNYLELARFCLEQGREAEALRHAEEGLWLFEDEPPDERLVAFVAERHLAADNNDAALAVLWRAFDRQPSTALYQRLRVLGGDVARDRVIAALRARLTKEQPKAHWSSPADLLVRVLMAETMFAEAWEVVHTHGGGDHLVLALAQASESSCPREAVRVYAAGIEKLVSAGGNPNYREACRLIARMAGLRDAAEQATYVATLRARFKAKRNFIKMLGA